MDRDEMIRRLPEVFRLLQEQLDSDPDWDMETVDWGPLHRVLPMAACDGCMFMGIHMGIRQYKHGFTRRYLLLDTKGTPYRYDGHGGYSRTTTAWAVRHVFEGLEEMGYTRTTPWNDETIAERDARLAAAGWAVVRGPLA